MNTQQVNTGQFPPQIVGAISYTNNDLETSVAYQRSDGQYIDCSYVHAQGVLVLCALTGTLVFGPEEIKLLKQLLEHPQVTAAQ